MQLETILRKFKIIVQNEDVDNSKEVQNSSTDEALSDNSKEVHNSSTDAAGDNSRKALIDSSTEWRC